MSDIASKIDHTLLKPNASLEEIEKLCAEAKNYQFFSVCIPPHYIASAHKFLSGSRVKICSVLGFPLGYQLSETKAEEARHLVDAGVHEIDMVMNIAALKNKNDLHVVEDIEAVLKNCGSLPLKVILETGLLSQDEKVRACEAVVKAGASFVKTCTGFSDGVATIADIELMRSSVGSSMGVKASGGIRDLATAQSLINAGANRLGCSKSVEIVKELEAAK